MGINLHDSVNWKNLMFVAVCVIEAHARSRDLSVVKSGNWAGNPLSRPKEA